MPANFDGRKAGRYTKNVLFTEEAAKGRITVRPVTSRFDSAKLHATKPFN